MDALSNAIASVCVKEIDTQSGVCVCQFYRCFVAFVRCRGEPQSVYGFNTQQSSREENTTPGTPLSQPSLVPKQHLLGSPHTLGYRNPSNSPLCGLRSEWHYTP